MPTRRRRREAGRQLDRDRIAASTESILLRFRQNVDDRMRELGMKRRDLADELGVSEGRISQVLSSADNITIRTMAALVLAVDGELDLNIVAKGNLPEQCRWFAEDAEAEAELVRMGKTRAKPGRVPDRVVVT